MSPVFVQEVGKLCVCVIEWIVKLLTIVKNIEGRLGVTRWGRTN